MALIRHLSCAWLLQLLLFPQTLLHRFLCLIFLSFPLFLSVKSVTLALFVAECYCGWILYTCQSSLKNGTCTNIPIVSGLANGWNTSPYWLMHIFVHLRMHFAVGMAQVRTENQEWISREFSSVLHKDCFTSIFMPSSFFLFSIQSRRLGSFQPVCNVYRFPI